MTFDQQWIEFDFNPFILFNASGKIVSLNTEAQYLLGAVEASAVYKIATTYASSSFGFKTTFLELEFGRFKFFGITVGYEDEEHIGIRLYQLPSFQFTKQKPEGQLVNVYTLIDLCISSNSIGAQTRFLKELDPTIPEIRLQTELFIKLLNKIYVAMAGNEKITTRLFFRVGEHIKFEGEKYSLFSIEIISDTVARRYLPDISHLAEENNLFVDVKDQRITINVPMIVK
jgi:nitrogen-specific signal transduction histidine kinase